jgi:hypothetical protein
MNRREFLKNIGIGAAALSVPAVVVAQETPPPPPPLPLPEPKKEVIFSTGFPTLDKHLGGGIRPGELMVVLGETGAGKSSFCNTIWARNCVWHHNASYYHDYDDQLEILALAENPLFFRQLHDAYKEPQGVPEWEKNYVMARNLREKAWNTNSAIIWTRQVNRAPYRNNDDEVVFPNYLPLSPLRCADYCISLKKASIDTIDVYLIKNRYGQRCKFQVKVEPGIVSCTLREKNESKD